MRNNYAISMTKTRQHGDDILKSLVDNSTGTLVLSSFDAYLYNGMKHSRYRDII